MKVEVLSIETNQKPNVFDVDVLYGEKQYNFEVEVESVRIGKHNALNVSGRRYLWDTLQHHPGVITKIYNLVLGVYHKKEVTLPALITNHLPINELLAKRQSPVTSHQLNGSSGSPQTLKKASREPLRDLLPAKPLLPAWRQTMAPRDRSQVSLAANN